MAESLLKTTSIIARCPVELVKMPAACSWHRCGDGVRAVGDARL
jgi:hypothetical protein